MRFGPVPVAAAEGAVLAHALHLPGGRLGKGRRLGPADLDRIAAAGLSEVIVARLEPGDVPEDEAAERIGKALAPDPGAIGLERSAPFTGRVNLYAAATGVLTLDRALIDAVNEIDEAITIATLPPLARLGPRQMAATVKIIPYAAPEAAVAEAERRLSGAGAIGLAGIARRSAGVILTRTPGMADKIVEKGAAAVRARLAGLGLTLAGETVVAHEKEAVAGAIAAAPGEIIVLLTGSATSDRGDVGPGGLIAAGGALTRFGMPVDPGNLLFLGEIGAGVARRPVVGLPGCARSPKLNGADWVLERIACGVAVSDAAIAGMGVGGLLSEIPSRPAPRGRTHAPPERPRVAALVLAAGSSQRMGGTDKLLQEIDGVPLIARVAEAAAEGGADDVLIVLPAKAGPRADAVASIATRRQDGGRRVRVAVNPAPQTGMAGSIVTGLGALGAEIDGVLILLADMPEIGAPEIARLIAAFDPAAGREIIRATAEDGTPGHPVLFGRRFFEALGALSGDRGARDVLAEHGEFTVPVALPGRAALTDLDTPEAWASWRAAHPRAGAHRS